MTPWRKLLYEDLRKLSLEGNILDLGGSKDSDYHLLIGGSHTITAVNIDASHGYDLSFNLEDAFPVHDKKYDAVLAINVMEHLFNHQQFLKEVHRILVPGGKAIIAVPFLVQVHPSPHDYFRYTGEALKQLSKEAGFRDVSIMALGRGPFTVASQIIFNILKFNFLRVPSIFIANLLDYLIRTIDRKGNFTAESYPLGFVVVVKK